MNLPKKARSPIFLQNFFEEREGTPRRRVSLKRPRKPPTAGGGIMNKSTMLNLYKETSVDLESASDKSIVAIQLPRPGLAGTWLPSPKRASPNDQAVYKDENSFAEHFLASEGSIYFRDPKRSPRSFLWRVLDGRKVLEIRCADLTRSRHEGTHEAYLTLRVEFAENILPSCVALADPPDHDVLNVFVLTAGKTLYTLTLRPDFFRRPGAANKVEDWCKTFSPPLFGSPFPHRLHASTASEVFFSLDDGSLVRLRRKSGDDGSHWEPTTYSDGAWTNSIRGLVKWQGQQSVRYNGRNLDLSTATAIATASDQTYVYTVSLNHTLKAWNLANRKLNITKDLLNKPRNPQDAFSLQLSPAESCFLRTFNAERAREGDRHYIVTFSPHDNGQFKFWAVRGGLTGPLIIEDLYPGEKFQPPDPDPVGNTIWNLSDFDLKTSETGNAMELLVLWKNNTAFHLNILVFDLFHLPQTWDQNWVGTTTETRHGSRVLNTASLDPVDATESWLSCIFHPGRFSAAVLETSLSVYQDAIRAAPKPQQFKGHQSLKERLCSTIASTVSLWRHQDGGMDYERYRTDTDSQWRQYSRIVEDVNKRRREPMSVVYDKFSDIPWVIQTAGCCAIRECSDTELLISNDDPRISELEGVLHERLPHRDKIGKQPVKLSSLIHIAAAFRKRFSSELAQACLMALDNHLFQEPTLGPAAQLTSFYEAANFSEYVSDDAFDNLSSNIEAFGGFQKIHKRFFYQILDTFPQTYEGGQEKLFSTTFGLRAMASGAEETLLMNWQILFDLLVLVVFVEVEVHQSGEKMDQFDAPEIFNTLIDQLKEYEMMKWLATNSRETTHTFLDSRGAVHSQSRGGDPEPYTLKTVSSLMENTFAKDVKPQSPGREPQSYIFTHTARDLVALMTRSGEVPYEEAVVFIQCEMIRNGNLDLASDFLRFQPNNAWSTYVKGRLHLAQNDFSPAAIYFQKAAYLLSHGRPRAGDLTEMSSHLLDLVDADCFNNGLPKYYQHILTLFERAKAYTHVTDFARLALDSFSADTQTENPQEAQSLRTELVSRLFQSSLSTSSFDSAYAALSSHTDAALRKSSISALITSMLTSQSGISHLLHLPLASDPRTATFVDSILLSHASKATPLSIHPPKHSTLPPSPPYHQILYSLRLSRNDYRGAASVLFSRLQLLRKAPTAINDPECKAIRHELLALINVLACVNQDEAYILAEIDDHATAANGTAGVNGLSLTNRAAAEKREGKKRRIVTLEDLRREYQGVLDRVSDIASGKFEFGAFGDEAEEDGEAMDFT